MIKNIKKRLLKNKSLLIEYGIWATIITPLALIGVFFYYTWDLPRPEQFASTPFIQSTKIYDRTGKVLLYNIYGEEKREIIPFEKISDNLKKAVLASEDAQFYQHFGIDITSLIRSFLMGLKLQPIGRGASTITQQLIKSTYLTNQRTLSRKVREIVLSIELERRYSKDQIFNWYLNKIPFGQNAYGIESASQTYFNIPASDLSLAQAATLTALMPAPSYYSPYGSRKNLLLKRKDYILEQMGRLGYITSDEVKKAQAEPITFSENTLSLKAPHFVVYVKQYLEDKYGEEYLQQKGLRVTTTLDWDLEQHAEKVIQEADKNNSSFNAHNAALVALDPKTGQILSLVGSKNYFAKPYPEGCDTTPGDGCLFDPRFNVATLGYRQPGSSFKPFVYATAFKKGYTPETMLWDVKTEFNTSCDPNANQEKDAFGNPCYHPQNYDGKTRGLTSLRSSLAQSLNIPSVQLLYLAGLFDSLKTAVDMGITTLNEPNRYGLSLVLGGGEVTLLEITSAYSAFATDGVLTPMTTILKIEDMHGNIIEENNHESSRVLDTQVARYINSILSDNSARAPMFGENNALHIQGYDVAAKTGTTEYFNDAWTIGYSPNIVVGVWVGNNNNASTNKKTGIGLAAPLWRSVIQHYLTSHPQEFFNSPSPAPENTPPILLGKIPPDNPPHTLLHYIDKNNPTGPPPQNPANDPAYLFWERGLQNWLNNPNQ